jgi:glycosyltransferase involved in cell wall biosynthesis
MRIALVDPLSYTPPYDHGLAHALAERGHDVTLLAGPFLHGSVPEPDGYAREEVFLPVTGRLFKPLPRSRLRLLLKGVEYLPSAGRLVGRLETLEPEIVHVQWLPRPELDRRWLRRLPAPSVFTAHDVLPRRARARAVWPEVLRSFGRVVVHSEAAVRELAELGVGATAIPHPVFEVAEPAASPTGQTLLFFGLIRDYKGLDVLIRALPDIPGARLVVAGDPVDAVEPVRAAALELGVEDRIDWRLGYVPDGEVPALFGQAAVVVLPYRRLDSSGVLATAIGYGRPVVVSDVGSLGQQVREFGAGRVVPPEDAAAFAQACNELLASPDELERAAAGARQAAGTLTWAASAAAHERLYGELA